MRSAADDPRGQGVRHRPAPSRDRHPDGGRSRPRPAAEL